MTAARSALFAHDPSCSHDLSRTGGEISLRVEIPPHAEAWRMVIVLCYCYCYWLDDELNIRQKDWWIVRATLKTLHVYCVWFAGSECMRICAQRRMELIPKFMQLVPGWQHGDIGQRIACKPEWSESSGTGIWYPLPYKQKKTYDDVEQEYCNNFACEWMWNVEADSFRRPKWLPTSWRHCCFTDHSGY